MIQELPHQLPWYFAGPILGILVAGLYAVANRPLGASGAYMQTLSLVRRQQVAEAWRAWYFLGILAGAVCLSLIRATPPIGWHYGALGNWLPLAALVPLLFGAGSLIGYGARWMGGCTSGHGLCGTSALNPPSFVAAGTFVGTGIVATAVLRVISGGAL